MIRFIVVWNVVLTVLVVFLLVGNRHDRLAKLPLQAGVQQSEVLRARRVELRDREGHLTAVLNGGPDEGDIFSGVGLTLLDPHGREAVSLGLTERGYGNLHFASSRQSAKVSVGYFSGADQVAPLSEVDPGGIWGIRVLRPNSETPQVFGVLDSGPALPTSP